MRKISAALTATFLLSALCAACGGGGSDSTASAPDTASAPSPPPAPAPAPAAGDYSGTYLCAATQASDEVFTAVLTTPSGNFSSCTGSVDAGSVALVCTGSISAAGAFSAISQDPRGQVSTKTGTVSGSTVTGTFSVPAVGINGATFACTRS